MRTERISGCPAQIIYVKDCFQGVAHVVGLHGCEEIIKHKDIKEVQTSFDKLFDSTPLTRDPVLNRQPSEGCKLKLPRKNASLIKKVEQAVGEDSLELHKLKQEQEKLKKEGPDPPGKRPKLGEEGLDPVTTRAELKVLSSRVNEQNKAISKTRKELKDTQGKLDYNQGVCKR